MPPHRKTSRAAERRKQRRQRQTEGDTPVRTAQTTRMAPLSLDPKPKSKVVVAPAQDVRMDRSTEYAFVRRDLWRLTVYSVICFALMIAVLLFVNA